jgi:hypothetical protein
VGVLDAAMPSGVGGAVPRELAILHIISTLHTTMRWWQDHDRDLTAAEADTLFTELVSKGLPKNTFAFFTAPRRSEPTRHTRTERRTAAGKNR